MAIVKLVEEDKLEEITEEFVTKLLGIQYFYAGGARDLEIVWLPVGTKFKINEYDGSESVQELQAVNWLEA